MKRTALLILLLALPAYGQKGAATTIRHGSSLPATCDSTGGQIYLLNNDGLYYGSGSPCAWVKTAGGSATWGGIGGTLSSQTDLQTALNGKAASNASTTVNSVSCALGSSCTVADATKVPTSRQINGFALTSDVNLASTNLSDGASLATLTATQTLTNKTFTLPILGSYAVSGLPAASSNTNRLAIVTDAGTAGSCTVGAGTALSLCRSNGTSWVPLGDGGSGGGNTTSTALTTNTLSKANGANSIVNSQFTDDGTNGAYTGTGGFSAPSLASTGAGAGTVTLSEGAVGTGTASKAVCRADSTAHDLKCSYNADTMATVTRTIAKGTAALGTSAIASGACASVVTVSATGTATTDTIGYTPNADPTAVTGYGPSATGSLYVWAYPTANNVNFKVCNNTGGSITPAALTLNWRVAR